jgi:hypothetical protein
MKNKLQSLIRQAINEVLNETTVPATISYRSSNTPDKVLKVDPADAETIQNIKTDPNIDHASVGNKKLKETELNEMAGANYKLADDYQDKLENIRSDWRNSPKRMVWINGIIDYLNDVGSDAVTQIADKKFGVPQARIADYAREMISKGVLEPAVAGFVPKFMQPEDEEGDEEPIKGGDVMAIGNTENPLAQYFDGKPNADGSEDFPAETEPELPAVREPFKAVGPVAKAAEFTTDNDRLIQKIIKLHGASKMRVKEALGDSELSGSDFAKAEKGRKETAIDQLPNLIRQLADKISMEDEETQAAILNILAKKFSSVGYSSLSKKIATALGTSVPQVQEPEIDDLGIDDTEEEPDQLDEYAKRKLQYYAGIIK